MARPIKTGIDYYPLNVDFLQDIKVRKIMRACGSQSITILISLLSSIYRDEGYYVVWDNDMSFLVADEVGASEGAVLEVVNKAVQIDFFNSKLFEEHNILTSKGIQKRFLEAVSRRKKVKLFEEYLLVDLVNDYKNIDNVNINSINVNRSTQSKVKESKEKKSKVKYAEYVSMDKDEYAKLITDHGEENTKKMITVLDNYKGASGKSYKSDYRAILNWVIDKLKKDGEYGGTDGKHNGKSKWNLGKEFFTPGTV